jgi:alanine-synthesizing transaminase
MFENIHFEKMIKLPNYVFAEVGKIKMELRRSGEDIIDFSMGNPDGPTPSHIIDKLSEAAKKPKNHGYSASDGIYKLRLAITNWYKRRYDVDLNVDSQVVATMGSKEGYVHLVQAITNAGDVAIIPDPTYPIHSYAFMLAGGSVRKVKLPYDENYEIDEEQFLENIKTGINESVPRARYVLINFPHNPTCATVTKSFYEKVVKLAKEESFYIISDIAYADITFDGFKTPSILEIDGAQDVAVETFSLSKSYNMAGWRVGFIVGNIKLVGALKKIKSWLDYGMFTPIQVAATVALNGDQKCVQDITDKYDHRQNVLIDAFKNAGWDIKRNKASMFVWAKLPKCVEYLGSLEFSKRLLIEAGVAVAPGIGFGDNGENYVRIALIENDKRIRQAARSIKKFLKKYKEDFKNKKDI